jgi:heme/copper-type cytochrome/quinol oxidase subunit 3
MTEGAHPMAHDPTLPAEAPVDRGHLVETPPVEGPPVTPGKVAMWLFLATEIMFFTGLIGSYVVLRAGSPAGSYSNLFPPATELAGLEEYKGVKLLEVGSNHQEVVEAVKEAGHLDEHTAEHLVKAAPSLVLPGSPKADAEALVSRLKASGAKAEIEDLKSYNWPLPFDTETDPLSINLTAANTFILICSSVTMVFALSAIQQGKKARCSFFLLMTVLIGATFLSIQVVEYYLLSTGHYFPIGISKTHHFRPSASLFASCFYTMTGFHGAHVTGGVILLFCILIASLLGKFSRESHSAVELAGLYWHFVDLVWIILFTVVYLV